MKNRFFKIFIFSGNEFTLQTLSFLENNNVNQPRWLKYMDIKKLNQDFEEIADKKTVLSGFEMGTPDYERANKDLEDLMHAFVENYGTYLEEALYEVHDEFCPDNDILSPLAYIAQKYFKKEQHEYEVANEEGVSVDADDFPDGQNRLVMIPSPCRLIIQNEKGFKEIVWQAGL